MEEQKIIYETAKSAKEKGFDTESNYLYCWVQQDGGKPKKIELIERDIKEYTNFKHRKNDDLCISVSQSQLQTWLRDIHNIHIYVTHKKFGVVSEDGYYYHIGKSTSNKYYGKFNSYEDALEMGLQEGLRRIKINKRSMI